MATKKFFFSLDLAGNLVKNQAAPVAISDGSNKGYVDDSIDTAVTTINGQLSALESALQADLASAVADLESLVATTDTNARTDIQGIINGLPPKKACNAISTTPITLSGVQTVDGVSLVAGNRVLVAGQGGDIDTPDVDNGVYVVAAGAWSRAEDLDSSDEVIPGMFVPVNQGTTYGDTQWFLLTDGIITPGTTALRFDRYGAADSVVAGDGLERDGHILNVVSADDEQLTVSASGVAVNPTFISYLLDLANSTNNLTTDRITGLLAFIHAVKLNELAAPDGEVSLSNQKLTNVASPEDSSDASTKGYVDTLVSGRNYSTRIGNGSDTVFTVTHNLGSKEVLVQLYSESSGATVDAAVVRTTNNAVQITFDGITPASNEFRVLIVKVADALA